MKDDWISPFQAKLGDYELDVPVPAPAGGRKWLLPVIVSVAAAAALALLLWLPGAKDPAVGPARLIAEAQPVWQGTLPSLQGGRLLADAPGHRFSQPTSSSSTSVPETKQPEATDTTPSTPDTPNTPDKPETPDTPDTPDTPNTPDIIPDVFPDIEPDPQRSASAASPHRLSFQLYAGNLRAGNPGQADPNVIAPLAYYSALMDVDGSDLIGNSNSNSTMPRQLYSRNAVVDNTFGSASADVECPLPIRTGLTVRYPLTNRFALESGLTYSFHRGKETIPVGQEKMLIGDWRLHYVGIPLKAVETVLGGRIAGLYLSEGAEVEMLAGGSYLKPHTGEKMAVRKHPVQLSVLAAAGVDIHLTRWLALYAEPGVAWHPVLPDDLPSYYREHPFSFDLRFGLRLDL